MERLQVKEAGEPSASSLQSPDDLEATCREKRGEGHRGYAASLTETRDPDGGFGSPRNDVLLAEHQVTRIQTARHLLLRYAGRER